MNKNKIMILFIILAVFYLPACTSYASYNNNDDDLKVLHDRTFKTEPGQKLKVTGSSGDILVTSWDRSEVQVKILGNDKAKEKIEFNFEQKGDLIEVTAKRDGWFTFGSGIHLRFEIKVPKKYHTSLHTAGGDIRFAGVEGHNIIKTSGGDIELKDVRGELEISTSGGDIIFDHNYGKLNYSTSGGDIKGKDFSGDVELSTSGGDINLEGNNSKIVAKTSGGDISLNYSGDNKGIELATSGGDITINVPAGFNAAASLNTSGGDVDCNVKTQNVKKLSSSRLEADLNNGGNKLSAKTSGGRIVVNEK